MLLKKKIKEGKVTIEGQYIGRVGGKVAICLPKKRVVTRMNTDERNGFRVSAFTICKIKEKEKKA